MSEQKYLLASEVLGLGLPDYAKPDSIGLHMPNIRRIAALAGYHGEVSVVGYAGENTESVVAVGGHAGGGAASAAMGLIAARTKPGELASAEGAPSVHLKGNFTVRLNTTHIKDALPKGRVRDPAAWAHVIDRTTASILSRAAWNHLVREKTPGYEKLSAAFMCTGAVGLSQMSFTEHAFRNAPEWSLPLFTVIVAELGTNLINSVMAQEEGRSAREVCWSLIPAKHVDRAAVAWLGTKVCTFAKVVD
ncbi:MAG TPA: hypothetical protein VLE73_00585 [Candidatus Saccharimonadales bacterium]|nr:hypothetical protein [Candidatus Saccharimonadales bacterium]